MTKRPVSLEAAMRAESPAPPEVTAAPASPDPAGKAAVVEKLTVYVPKVAARRLRQMALDHDRRVNDFLQEGVDLMLAKYGQPSLSDFEGK